MKKRLSALLAGILSAAIIGSVGVFAVEPDGVAAREVYNHYQSRINTITIGDYTYNIYTDANYDTSVCNAVVWAVADAVLPVGILSVRAVVMNEDRVLLRDTGFWSEPAPLSFGWAQTTNVGIQNPTYFGGVVYISNRGSHYPDVPALKYENGQFTYLSKLDIPTSIADLPVNSQGLCYGSFLDGGAELPDLISAMGVDGNVGYVLRQDFSPIIYNAQGLERINERIKENNLIPVYDLEGNQIDWYALGNSDEVEPDSITQARIQELSARDLPTIEEVETATNNETTSPFSQEFDGDLVNGDFPRNANGETFGTFFNQYVVGYAPDYMAYRGDHDVDGYMRFADYTRPKQKTVNLYDMDGNIVDQFTFKGTFGHG